VENAIPSPPKLANRNVPEGGFDHISRTKNGAASACPKNDRRPVMSGSYYFQAFRLRLFTSKSILRAMEKIDVEKTHESG
jgi:hypothetical protein